MPAMKTISERLFSSLCRIKNYLRSTMNQDRLNYLLLLTVHKPIADQLNVIQIANHFVQENEH